MKAKAHKNSLFTNAFKVFGVDYERDLLTYEEVLFGYKKKRPKLLFVNDNILFKTFNATLLLLAVFTCVAYPIEFGFEPKLPTYYGLIESIIDLCFAVDILLNFFITYSDPNTHSISHHKN